VALTSWLLEVYRLLNQKGGKGGRLLLYVSSCLNAKNMESYPNEFCLLLKVMAEHFKALVHLEPEFDWNAFLANLLTLFFMVEVRHEMGHIGKDPSLAAY
jgi:hypothetical protein